MEDRKLRRYTLDPVTVRSEGDGSTPVITGYAAVFNQEAVIGGLFREVIAPGAFMEMVNNPPEDLKALFNHNPDNVLGGISSNTLRISEDTHGLRYEVDINTEDPAAMAVYARIKRGDVNKSSFGFSVPEGGQTISRDGGQMPLRTITRATLFDVSPVVYPAYSGTSSMSLRDLESDAQDAEEVMDLAREDESPDDAMAQTEIRRRRQRIVEATL